MTIDNIFPWIQQMKVDSMEIIGGLLLSLLFLLILRKFDFIRWFFLQKVQQVRFANFNAVSAEQNGIVPSKLDKRLDSWKSGEVLYFFGFNC